MADAAAAPAPLRAEGLTLAYGERRIAEGLGIEVREGEIVVVTGPNACGKSTLLRALARLLVPAAGCVLLDGEDISRLPTKRVARRLGFLPQDPSAPHGIVVADLVARGRYPHQRLLRQWSDEDERAVEGAMAAMGVTELADRVVDELSGGQRQRAWIAMAIAQETPVLLLDEPTSYLDIAHQLEVLELCRRINRERGTTLVLVLHDLNQAARYADRIIVMREGRVLAAGPPKEVLTPSRVEEAFGVRALVRPDPVTGTPMVIPLPPQGAQEPLGEASP